MGKLSKELRMAIHNRFDIEVVDKDTGEVRQRAQALNVVCTGYFEQILSRRGALPSYYQSATEERVANIVYGDGTGTPSSNDTALFHQLGTATVTSAHAVTNSDDVNGVWSVQCKFYINYDAAVGKTITEVGYKLIPSPNTLLTHATLQDMNGNPISILHTDTDIINIYATVYMHYVQGTNDIYLYDNTKLWGSGLVADYLGLIHSLLPRYACRGVNGAGGFFYSAGMPCEATQGMVTRGRNSGGYDLSQKKYTEIATRLGTSEGNLGGIHFFGAYNSNSQSNEYTPNIIGLLLEAGGTTIPSATITDESVGTGNGSTTKFKTKFHCPYNATVRVNGVAQTSGVRVIKAPRVTNGLESSGAVSYDSTYGSLWVKRVYKDNPAMPRPFDSNSGGKRNGSYLYAGECYEITAKDIGLLKFSTAIDANEIFGSNDGTNWTALAAKAANATIPDAEAHYKYYYNSGTKQPRIYYNAYDGYNIIFDTAPAQGDVITIDYTTDYIPKDADHVLDLTVTFTFGDWQGN